MTTVTYVGTRTHPTLGVLLKVGVSNDPARRARELGITIHAVLPERCEAEIHGYLRSKRVWRAEPEPWKSLFWITPAFPAYTEWFYTDPVIGDWLRAYIRFARETEGLLVA